MGFQAGSFAQSPLDNFLETLSSNAVIEGRVYLDTNGNGTQDNNENGIENVTMLIINNNNTGQFATTNADGDWSITVIPGLTQVFAATNSLPNGVIQTEGTNPTILNVPDVSDEPDAEPIDIGSYGFFLVGNLQGNLYLDVNGNGTQDDGESGIEDVEIFLTDQFGNVQTVLTNEVGEWEFQIGAGEVISEINQNHPNFPTGAFQTEGTDPTTTIIEPGETVFSEDDGFFEAGIIEGTLYLDSNGNGTQDAGEPGIANVEVEVETSLNTTITLTTDTDGNWSVMTAVGDTNVSIDETQENFPIGSTQTEGTNPTNYTIEIGQVYQQVDGFYESGNIQGRVYLDENANGTQDNGETGIPNIPVDILKSTGETETVISDTEGDWSLEVPIGETVSTIDTSSPEFPNLFIQTEGTNPTTSNILTNESISEFDGFAEAAEISGTVYEDADGNGNQEAGETGLQGIEVSIEDQFGNVQVVTTNPDGIWSVLVLAGNVTVEIDENQPNFPDNAILTEGSNPFSTLTVGGETYTANYGYFILEDDTAEINGNLYLDINGNGNQDANEPGIPDVEIEIIDATNATNITETDENGNFTAIVTGGPTGVITYTINENDPDFPIGAIQTEGTNPTSVVVSEGISNFVGDNGYFVPDQNTDASLDASVYEDANGNGTQDNGETGIPNTDVIITDSFGNSQTVVTDANGNFTATVTAGNVTYEIDENDTDFPTGAIQTEGTNPTTIFAQPNQNNFGGNNGYFVPDQNSTGTLDAHLYFDENGDGIQQATEADMPNVDVEITDVFGNSQTLQTNANGDFSANVVAGNVTYNINENDPDFPTGAIQTEGTNPTTVFINPDQTTFGGNNGFFSPDLELEATLSAHLYIDENGNATQQASEPNLPNVEVTITDSFGNEQTVNTDANGDFSATVVAGSVTYQINEDDPDFPVAAIQTEGTNPTTLFIVPNTDAFGGNNGFFVPDSNEQGNLTAHLYFDENGDGTQQATEPNMPNVEVEITDVFGNSQILETDENGDFTTTVIAGNVTYEIDVNDLDFPIGAIQTEGTNPTLVFITPDSNTFGGNNGFFDFSDSEDEGAVTGLVYLDENGNGTQDSSEPGIANIEVIIQLANGNTLSVFTGLNGVFSALVEEGFVEITINEDDPNFPEQAVQTEGINPNNVVVSAGNTTDSGSYGYFVPDENITTNIFTHLYIDEDGNGTQDAGEPDLANIDVLFTDAFGNNLTVSTDANGNAEANLSAGNIEILVDEDDPDFPVDAIQTEGTNPTNIIALASQNNFGGENGFFVPDDNGGEDQTILSAHLYLDQNGNGTQDLTEPDLENVSVEVIDNAGAIQNIQTNANGDFSVIVAVGSVTYTIDEDDPNLPNNAVQTEGTNPTTLTAIADQNNFGGNNGFFEPDENITTSLVLNIYLDENGNGTQDGTEPNLVDVSVTLTDALGNETQLNTNANGIINAIIPPGQTTYLIDENDPNIPENAIQTEGTNPTTIIALTEIENQGGSNGFFVPNDNEDQTIFSTHVYFDENGNGTQDNNEPDLPNVDISILEASGNQFTLTTNANGNISTQVEAGEITYTIDEESPGIPEDAFQTEGTNPTTLTAELNQNNFGGNNGYFVPQPSGGTAFIITHLYFDINGDGNQDADEPNMVDVEVFVTDPNQTISLSSDGNGNIITQVTAGEITVEINELDPDFPTGAIQTEGTNPTTVNVNQGSTFYIGDNGFFVPDDDDITTLVGHLYLDDNANGTQDNNEADLPNIDVIITDSDGNEQTVSTNPNGDFVANVSPGNLIYLIDEDDPDFPANAIQTEGTNPTNVNAIEGEENFGGNNGYFTEEPSEGNAIIITHLYYDDDGNGNQDNIEADMTDVEVFVTDANGTQSFISDDNGNIIAEVSSGEITIDINQLDPNFPTGAVQTEGTNPTTVNVNEGTTLYVGDNGFFFVEDVNTSIFGHIYLDENSNGTQDNNEPDLANINVIVNDSAGNEQTIITNPNGDFIANVEPGEVTYLIDESSPAFPAGAVQTEGTNPTTVTALEADNTFGGNNGYFLPTNEIDAAVFGHLYEDLNNNGTQDADDPNLVDVEVEIIDQTGTIYTLFSDNNGDFDTELASGLATITINENDPNFPQGAIQTEGTNPTSILLPVDENTDAGNFGFYSDDDDGGGGEDDDGIDIFNAVSPNGDGNNEFLRIEGLQEFPDNNVKIYDRSGVKVFDTNRYGFNGNVFRGISEGRISVQKNKRLPTGTYFYLLEYEDENGEQKRKQGYLYLN
ncbi:hypothetical protein GCM10010832_00150 [Psychroflexus planctonicus]|uniref:SD-repeat containing protein B domain-containing protein n=2 Tax=Psychroflexus planctonicus TaxID=1526575 RepID=A0ABQ1SB61_9FLAO|nr:hypothetical protein GCM10010832_00150 [Psychroflexus planctonicus]